jgi:hypothetical protein
MFWPKRLEHSLVTHRDAYAGALRHGCQHQAKNRLRWRIPRLADKANLLLTSLLILLAVKGENQLAHAVDANFTRLRGNSHSPIEAFLADLGKTSWRSAVAGTARRLFRPP